MEIRLVDSFMTYKRYIRIILDELHKEKNVEFISVNCMDILNRYTTIIVYDKKTADLIGKELNIDFINLKATTNTLISRKEIINIMREIYTK